MASIDLLDDYPVVNVPSANITNIDIPGGAKAFELWYQITNFESKGEIEIVFRPQTGADIMASQHFTLIVDENKPYSFFTFELPITAYKIDSIMFKGKYTISWQLYTSIVEATVAIDKGLATNTEGAIYVNPSTAEDSTLQTTSKTVTGAINEVFQSAANSNLSHKAIILQKGGTVTQSGAVPTDTEINNGILSIPQNATINKIEGITRFVPTLCAKFFHTEMIYDSVTEIALTSDMTRNAGRDGEWAASFLVSIFSAVYYSYDTYEYNVFYYLDKRYHEHIFKMESNSKYCLRLLQWYETLVMKSMLQVIEYSRKGGIEYKKSSSELYTFVTDKDSLETTYTLPSPITYENEHCRYVAGYPNSLSFKYDGRWYTLQSPWCNDDIPLDSSPVTGLQTNQAIEIDGYIHTVGLTAQKTYRVSNGKTGRYRLIVALNAQIGVIIE